MEHTRVRTLEACFDWVFLEHQVVAFQLHVSIWIAVVDVLLYFCNILHEFFWRGEINDKFAVGEGRGGDGTHKVVARRSTTNRGGDILHFWTLLQILSDFLQVLFHLSGVGALRQLVFHVELVVLHVGEESLVEELIAPSSQHEHADGNCHSNPSEFDAEIQHLFQSLIHFSCVWVFLRSILLFGGCLLWF